MLGTVIEQISNTQDAANCFIEESDEQVLSSIFAATRELFVNLESECGSTYIERLGAHSEKGIMVYDEKPADYIHRIWTMKEKNPSNEYYGICDELLLATHGADSEAEMHQQALERANKMLERQPEYQRIAVREAQKSGYHFYANHILPVKFDRVNG